jgi:hypothetical protein
MIKFRSFCTESLETSDLTLGIKGLLIGGRKDVIKIRKTSNYARVCSS